MNIILVMSDSYRYDNLSCYGPTQVKTPRLDQFAEQSFVFDNAYLGSFPTIPNRLDFMTGRFSFVDHEWCPLPEDAVTLQQILSASGVTSYLIADNPHLVEMGFNYDRGYDAFEWIRGQETDRWATSPKEVKLPPSSKNRSQFILKTYLRNRAWWQSEEDRFVACSIKAACKWLDDNQDQDQFYLHVDLFDPHEPWDAPQKYLDLYEQDYQGEEILFPYYDFWRNFLSQEELNHVRALYMAEATMVDHWFGVLLDKIDELGLSEDTAVIFTSDHGYLFGEHDLTGKSLMPEVDGRMHYEAILMYDEIRRTPLLIRLPRQIEGQHIGALVQSPDMMPTLLEMAGMVATESVGGQSRTQALQCGVFYTEDWEFKPGEIHGRSLMPLMRDETERLRDIAVCSNTLIHHTPILAKCAVVTEDGWCLHYAGKYEDVDRAAAMFISKLMPPEGAKVPTEPALFHLPEDPKEENNVIDGNQGIAREIHDRYVKWLEEAGTPEEHLAGRRKLR
jgi:arylsulfatase A-like enzyme